MSGLLSALFPGAGQFYSEHYIDGAQALIVVGAGFIYSTVAYQSYQDGLRGSIFPAFTIGMTSLFHYGNILGAYRTAIYRNMKLKRDFLSEPQNKVNPYDLSSYLSVSLTLIQKQQIDE